MLKREDRVRKMTKYTSTGSKCSHRDFKPEVPASRTGRCNCDTELKLSIKCFLRRNMTVSTKEIYLVCGTELLSHSCRIGSSY